MTGRQSERRKPQAAKNLEFMHKGSHLVKVRGANKTYRRFFKVDDDFLSFGYRGSKKIKWARNLLGDSEDMSKVYISEVQDVRPGPISDVFVKSFDDLKVNRSRCFSVVIGEKHKTLDLVASNKETRDAWVNGLRHLRKKMSEADLSTQQEIWMRELFRYADKNNDNSLSLKEIITLLKHLNIEVDHDQAKQIFESDIKNLSEQILDVVNQDDEDEDDEQGSQEGESAAEAPSDGEEAESDPEMGSETDSTRADTNKTKNKKGEDVLDIDEFISFYQLITQRRELVELFELYNYEGKYLDRSELKDFIDAEQYMEIEEEMCGHLIKEFEPCPTVKDQGMMALDGFNALMNSPLMDLFNVDHKVVFQDMSRPMSDYFIDSSHNTYLTADQLVGPSAVEAYIRALKRGCRCVEFDCYDGKEGPVVKHGFLHPRKIPLQNVLEAVGQSAFTASKYPVILSIENHCSVDQQKVMAKYFVDILGDKLYTTPYPEDMQQLPSPESLKNKILIKAKKLKPRPGDQVEDEEGDVSDEDEAAEIVDDIVDRKIGQKKRQLRNPRVCDDIPFIDEIDGIIERHDLTHELSDLGDILKEEFNDGDCCYCWESEEEEEDDDDEEEDDDEEDDDDDEEEDEDSNEMNGEEYDEVDGAAVNLSNKIKNLRKAQHVLKKHFDEEADEEEEKQAKYLLAEHIVYETNRTEIIHDRSLEKLKNRLFKKIKKCWKKRHRRRHKIEPGLSAKKIPISHRSYEEDEVSDEDEAADLVAEEVKVEVKEKKGGDHKIKLARELSDLVTICQSVSFKSFDYARSNSNCKQMSSFAEGKAEGLVEDSPLEYIKHNQFQFSRIYPGGLRTDSSNYDPVQMWNVGCQIVALNYQTADEPMMLNKGLFMMNGGSGYILKPDFLTSPDTTFNPSGPFPEEWKKTLTLTIISGYQLPKKKKDKAKNILDPYAKVSIYGVRADHQSVQTEVIQNNGFHPEWNATFQLEVKVPDLALVWFQVKDDQPLARNHMVAQYCLPFNSLQQGYRTIHLKTKMGEPIFGAALLVHVMIR